MSGLSANKTKISYKKGASSTFTELPDLMEVPEFGGAPEKIDLGDLVFKFLYDNSSETSNYRVLKAMDDAAETVTFQLEYPDNTSHQFDAIPSVKMDAGAINGALTFSVTMLLQSDITVTNPTA